MRFVAIITLLVLTGCKSVPDGYKDDWTPKECWLPKSNEEIVHVPDW